MHKKRIAGRDLEMTGVVFKLATPAAEHHATAEQELVEPPNNVIRDVESQSDKPSR